MEVKNIKPKERLGWYVNQRWLAVRLRFVSQVVLMATQWTIHIHSTEHTVVTAAAIRIFMARGHALFSAAH
jgi:hypothetical protein